MKALNKQERNSAILRFSLWLLICVLIICVPVMLTGLLRQEQHDVNTGEKEMLIKEVNFEKDYIATKVQEIKDLMDRKNANEMDADVFNAKLTNINSDITEHSTADTSWRGTMYRNIVIISEHLIEAKRIEIEKGATQAKDMENKEQMIKDLDNIILELESCKENLADLNSQKKKKDISNGLDDVLQQLQRVLKLMNNYKSGLK
jgi:hypothetical protein